MLMVRVLLSVLAGSVLLGGVVSLLAPQVAGHHHLAWIFLAAISGWSGPAICLGLSGLFLIWGEWRAGGLLAALVALALGASALMHPAQAVVPSGPSLRVMSINTKLGMADVPAIEHLVREQDTDVLVLMETNRNFLDDAEGSGLARILPYHSEARGEDRNTVIWSRTPLTSVQLVDGTVSDTVMATINVQSRAVTIVGAHPWNPVQGIAQWWSDYALLTKAVQGIRGDKVVLGDFNATTAHAPFRALLADTGLVDAMKGSPEWAQGTYPSEGFPFFPIIRIDHILTDPQRAVVVNYHAISVPGSDHRGVQGTVRFR